MSSLVELYKFTQNGTDYFYTSSNEEATYDGDTYDPETIGRSSISQTSELNRDVLSIMLPRDNTFGADYVAYSQDARVSVTIYRQESGATSQIWTGYVAGHSITKSEVTIECESISSSQRRSGAYARCQKMCRHALYSSKCGVTAASYAVSGTCIGMSGKVATVTEAGSAADTTYTAGMIEYSGIRKYVQAHTGTALTLTHHFKALEDAIESSGSVSVNIYPGCAHNLTACINDYANEENFGGFPFIPSVDPFKGTPVI